MTGPPKGEEMEKWKGYLVIAIGLLNLFGAYLGFFADGSQALGAANLIIAILFIPFGIYLVTKA